MSHDSKQEISKSVPSMGVRTPAHELAHDSVIDVIRCKQIRILHPQVLIGSTLQHVHLILTNIGIATRAHPLAAGLGTMHGLTVQPVAAQPELGQHVNAHGNIDKRNNRLDAHAPLPVLVGLETSALIVRNAPDLPAHA